MQLEPLAPAEAVELYADDRHDELSAQTRAAHRSRLGHFIRWADQEGLDNLNDLGPRDLQRYRVWRRDDGDLNTVSLRAQLSTLRVFIRWCENISAIRPDTHLHIRVPTLDHDEGARDEKLDPDDARAALENLAKFEYASRRHVTLHLAWHTAMRRGSLRALDVEDYHPDDAYLEVRHRPDTETPLKNGRRGERLVALSADTVELLDDWLADRRPDTEDEHGRCPLLATTYGRASQNTIQKDVYSAVHPCRYGPCPHDRDPAECKAATDRSVAYECPSSLGPHAVRRGSITHHLAAGVPQEAVTGRANVSADVLDKHYDRRSQRELMEQRRAYLNNL